MVGAMKSPKTFTREDIIEINTHGGIVVTNEILQLAIREGARLAEPGEFTKRAFLNGRVDLTQAEGSDGHHPCQDRQGYEHCSKAIRRFPST